MDNRRKVIIGLLVGIQGFLVINGVVENQIEKRNKVIAREARMERARELEAQIARCHTDDELPSDRFFCMTPGEKAGRRLGNSMIRLIGE